MWCGIGCSEKLVTKSPFGRFWLGLQADAVHGGHHVLAQLSAGLSVDELHLGQRRLGVVVRDGLKLRAAEAAHGLLRNLADHFTVAGPVVAE